MWTNFSDLDRTFAALDLFRRRFEPLGEVPVAPRFLMREDTNAWIVKGELPGVGKDDLKIEVDQGEVTLRATRRPLFALPDGQAQTDELVRTFQLPRGVDTAGIAAELKDGILTLTLPKQEEQKPKRIDVRVA